MKNILGKSSKLPSWGTALISLRYPQGETPVQFLLGQRHPDNLHGGNCYAFPGGSCEDGESLVECVLREYEEETGLVLSELISLPKNRNLSLLKGLKSSPPEFIPNLLGLSDHRPRVNHLTAWFYTVAPEGEPVVKEPHKQLNWNWFTWPEVVEIAKIPDHEYWVPSQIVEQMYDLSVRASR